MVGCTCGLVQELVEELGRPTLLHLFERDVRARVGDALAPRVPARLDDLRFVCWRVPGKLYGKVYGWVYG